MPKRKDARFMVRQGDVLVFSGKPPANALDVPRESGAVILAHGEATGHAHAIRDPNVCMLRAEGVGDRWITVGAVSRITHEEHDAITIGEGTFTVRIQREWHGGISRRVED